MTLAIASQDTGHCFTGHLSYMWRLFVPNLFSGLHFLWVVLGSYQAPSHYSVLFVAKLCGYKKKSVKSSSEKQKHITCSEVA